jgi:hypothetical protein
MTRLLFLLLLAMFGSIEPSAAEPPPLRRGVNTFPWIYRAQTLDHDGKAFDQRRLFPYFGAFKPDDFNALRASGVDFVRAIVDPSPLLAADPPQRDALIAQIIAEIHKASGQGLAVIVDLHPRESLTFWNARAILTSQDMKARYEAMVVAFAAALAREGDGVDLLELMNEPPGGFGRHDDYGWLPFQEKLVKAARAVAPRLPLVVTGDRGGGFDGLLRLDVKSIDAPAILYSFHYYAPMVVTHQRAKWTSKPWRQYLSGIPYPPAPSEEPGALARVRDAISRDKSVDSEVRQRNWDDARAALLDYFHNTDANEAIRADFARVAAWAEQNRIAPSRILLGEFGVFRPGASIDAAAKWTHDVRTAAEINGFAWGYFNYAPFDENGEGFSLLQMTGPHPNDFDAEMLTEGLGLQAGRPGGGNDK